MDTIFKTAVDTSLRYARLQVGDLARALGFYRDVLGFHVASAGVGQAVLSAQGSDSRPIFRLTERPGARPKPRRATGLYHAAILLPSRHDLGRMLEHILQADYPLQGASDHHISEALYLADPDGNGLEIYADRPRDRWRMPDGEWDITTAALDVDDLLAQSGVSAAWTGMPAGTTLGHIHLHVADLARATEFYHDVLGLDRIMYIPEARMSFLSAGGYHHHIGLNTWAGEGAPRAPEEAAGLLEYAWRIPDADAWRATLERARERGSLIAEPADDGAFTSAALRDPDGNTVLVSVETARLSEA